MTSASETVSRSPLEVIGVALEAQGVRRFDLQAFLLGFVLGRARTLDPDEIRHQVDVMYPRRTRRKKTAA